MTRENIIYDSLALIYDHLMKKVKYDLWADYIFTIADNYLKDNAKVLELGGGNCKLARRLYTYYQNIIVTDLSAQMLKRDERKVIKKVCCDMSALPFKTGFDLIFSTFDSVNYLLTKKKLLSLFYEVSSLLSGNGIFTFDASLERNSLKHIEEPVRKGIYKGITYVHQSFYDKEKRIHQNIFEINIPGKGVAKEVHKQKIYPFETFFELLDEAGLYVAECFNAFTFDTGDAKSKRVQFVVKKGRQNAVIQ